MSSVLCSAVRPEEEGNRKPNEKEEDEDEEEETKNEKKTMATFRFRWLTMLLWDNRSQFRRPKGPIIFGADATS